MSKIRLIHTADVHIGMKFEMLGKKGNIQRKQVKDTFGKVIDTTLSERVDALLIAGDLFDSNTPAKKDVDFVYEQFSKLKKEDMPIIMIPGNHDYYCEKSVYKKYNFSDKFKNVVILKESGEMHIDKNLDTAFFGFPNLSKRSHQSPFQGFTVNDKVDTGISIGIAHGSYNMGVTEPDDHVFELEEIEKSQLSYVALGHWHSPYEVPTKKVKSWYPGSPECTSSDQKDRGIILFIETDGISTIVKRLPIGKRLAENIDIDVSGLESLSQTKKQIIKLYDQDKILNVGFKGLRNKDMSIDVSQLEDELSGGFFKVKFKDESHLETDTTEISSFSDETVIGQFVNIAKEEIENSEGEERVIKERALQIGLAVLQGKEVL